jgi:hypothetical protein
MRRAGLVLFGGAFALAASPALAKADPCALIKALDGESPQTLAGISATVQADGTSNVTYRGKATPLIGASDCELDGPQFIFTVRCNWSTEDNLEASQQRHKQLLGQLNGCFAGGMVLQDYQSKVEGLEVIDYYRGVREGKDGSQVDVDLEIHRYFDDDRTSTYAVILSISR